MNWREWWTTDQMPLLIGWMNSLSMNAGKRSQADCKTTSKAMNMESYKDKCKDWYMDWYMGWYKDLNMDLYKDLCKGMYKGQCMD